MAPGQPIAAAEIRSAVNAAIHRHWGLFFLIVEGVATVLFALEHRKGASGRWSWLLASGILDIALGGILLAGLPGTAVWALGLLVGINMIFGGWALVWMALHARAEVRGSPPQMTPV